MDSKGVIYTSSTRGAWCCSDKCLTYERLEFIGNAVLSLLIAREVYIIYPHLQAGPLILRSPSLPASYNHQNVYCKEVIMISPRRIVTMSKKSIVVVHPYNHTLTTDHEGILEDVVYPTKIVGKLVRYQLNGSKIMKIFLDPKKYNTENKLDTFSGVYRKLYGMVQN